MRFYDPNRLSWIGIGVFERRLESGLDGLGCSLRCALSEDQHSMTRHRGQGARFSNGFGDTAAAGFEFIEFGLHR